MVIRIYWASVTGNRKIGGDQTRLRYIIESLNIPSEWIDITTDPLIRGKMREECGKPKAMPPQIFNEFKYLGEVEDMEEFIEQERTLEFFEMGDVTDGDVEPSSSVTSSTVATDGVVNGYDKLNDVSSDDVSNNTRSESSPTSSIENDRPTSQTNNKNEIVSNQGPPPPRKNVLAAAGVFEAMTKNPPVRKDRPKVIFTHSKSINSDSSEDKKPVDEERRRKILGISVTENTKTSTNNSSITKPVNAVNGSRGVNKLSITSTRFGDKQEAIR